MEGLLSLVPGGALTAAGALLAAVAAAAWRIFAAGRKSARHEARAKEADSYEQELERIEKAAAARADAERRARAGELHDRHTRDR